MQVKLNHLLLILCLFIFLVLGCETIEQEQLQFKNYSPAEAIQAAAEAGPEGVRGFFKLRIQSSGRSNGVLYLNTELDYRDSKCLTVAIGPDAQLELMQIYGQDIDSFFIGRELEIYGVTKRVKIWFYEDGERTEDFYYQTHLIIQLAEQLRGVN